MKKLLFIIWTVMTPIIVSCQVATVNFKDCSTNQMFVSADTEPKWKCDTLSVVRYLNKSLQNKGIQKIENGKILIGILIHPDGKTCCYSFANLTKTTLDAEKIKEAINNMPNWTPAKQNGEEITFLKQQLLFIRNGKFVAN